MKMILRRIINGILSILTTLMIMASPVAAVVYAAEPIAAVNEHQTYDVAQTAPVNLYSKNAKDLKLQVREWDTELSEHQPVDAKITDPPIRAVKIVE